jgi:4'-phosphopantetheinyl transferase
MAMKAMSITTKVFAVKIPDEIDVYLFEDLMPHIQLVKEMRIRQFKKEKDRLRTLFGDLLVRYLIIHETGIKNETIGFELNPFGKPFLAGHNDVHFNISHAGDWVVAAIDSSPVGIDIEYIMPVNRDLSSTVFSKEENRILETYKEPDQWLSYFFNIWALKESFIKFIGEGASYPLDQFSIDCTDPHHISIKIRDSIRYDIHLKLYPIHKDYKMALCLNHNYFPKTIQYIKVDALTQYFLSLP